MDQIVKIGDVYSNYRGNLYPKHSLYLYRLTTLFQDIGYFKNLYDDSCFIVCGDKSFINTIQYMHTYTDVFREL